MYSRFLKDSDYLSLLTKEAFNQLVRGVSDRVWEAEEVSEASLVEYLKGKFEIEKALMVGKAIKEYNPQITYPASACFSIDDISYKAIKTLNGVRKPTKVVYWEEYGDVVERLSVEDELERSRVTGEFVDLEKAFENTVPNHTRKYSTKYSQRNNYQPGQIVYFANKNFICRKENGPDFGEIAIPGIKAWEEVETEVWEQLKKYKKNDVVEYDGLFYVLLKDYVEPEPELNEDGEDSEGAPEEPEVESEYDPLIPPSEAPDDVWGLIADYDESETYQLSDTEWVVNEGSVFIPVMDPNATKLVEGETHILYDPRNANIKKHMLRMAVYELHKIIAPHNISSARITDYEATLQWLQDASRLKIDPGIPRKFDRDEKKQVSSYGLATFRRDYNPNENEWQI